MLRLRIQLLAPATSTAGPLSIAVAAVNQSDWTIRLENVFKLVIASA